MANKDNKCNIFFLFYRNHWGQSNDICPDNQSSITKQKLSKAHYGSQVANMLTAKNVPFKSGANLEVKKLSYAPVQLEQMTVIS